MDDINDKAEEMIEKAPPRQLQAALAALRMMSGQMLFGRQPIPASQRFSYIANRSSYKRRRPLRKRRNK